MEHDQVGSAVAADPLREPVETTLDQQPPPPDGPRTRFTRRRDLLAVLVIVLVLVAATGTWWWFSDARATTSVTGPATATAPPRATAVPATMKQLWQAASGATTDPVVVGPTVVTAEGHQVIGHDPVTGATRWSYTRDNLDLCTVAAAWGKAVVVYHKEHNCSEVTELDGVTGARGAQRNGDAELGTQLLYDGTYLTTTGKKLIDTWRSDLVQTQQYGTVTAVVNHDKQPRTGCTYSSQAATAGSVAVIEQCAGESFQRLTVIKPEGTQNDGEKPNVAFSVEVPGGNARIVAVTDQRVAVAVANPNRLVVWDNAGSQVGAAPLPVPDADLAGAPKSAVEPSTAITCTQQLDPGGKCEAGSFAVSYAGGAKIITWYSGSKLVALDPSGMSPTWTLDGALGSGTVYADKLLVPVAEGLAVLDPLTGARSGTITVDRKGYTGPVRLSTLGDVLLEQRGGTVVALR
ncbi:hypothetical protein BC739_007267 [Kutzneria viridogrisea]|uniref:Pyrroloquinoline-quinone binding quinoprotein n=1 Tax=Kutzneria viridogrisea TaxID=47990 RepID=A0ABR6BSY2_9PSEU|nr:hypothetical protein [Kutzneria viridogrisea]